MRVCAAALSGSLSGSMPFGDRASFAPLLTGAPRPHPERSVPARLLSARSCTPRRPTRKPVARSMCFRLLRALICNGRVVGALLGCSPPLRFVPASPLPPVLYRPLGGSPSSECLPLPFRSRLCALALLAREPLRRACSAFPLSGARPRCARARPATQATRARRALDFRRSDVANALTLHLRPAQSGVTQSATFFFSCLRSVRRCPVALRHIEYSSLYLYADQLWRTAL